MNSNNLYMTQQRRIILEELKKVTSHPTADEVFQMVRRRLPRISLGTVYRNLEILSKSGVIMRLPTGSPQMRFDGNSENHCHVRCKQCGKVDDVDFKIEPDPIKSIDQKSDYLIEDYNIEFIGLCGNCKSALGNYNAS